MADGEEVDDEAERDQHQQREDRDLERAVAPMLEPQHGERHDCGHEPGQKQRQPEDEMQTDRRAGELGKVGRHRDRLRLQPEHQVRAAREQLATELGQAPAGHEAELGGLVLDQHRHQARHHHDPDQQVAVFGAGLKVGREVARVDVRDGGHESRTRQCDRGAQPAAGKDRLERAGSAAPRGPGRRFGNRDRGAHRRQCYFG